MMRAITIRPPCRGHLGLWALPQDIAAEVQVQLWRARSAR